MKNSILTRISTGLFFILIFLAIQSQQYRVALVGVILLLSYLFRCLSDTYGRLTRMNDNDMPYLKYGNGGN